MAKDFKDFLGREIKEGDFIVYPGRVGSSLWMQKGIVKALVVDEHKIWWPEERIEKEHKLKVEIDVEKWNWNALSTESKKAMVKKLVTIERIARCTVIEQGESQ